MTNSISAAGGHKNIQRGEMLCYLIRHAEAEPAVNGDDAARSLTKNGRHDAREIFAVLAALATGIDRIYTSPLLRARQTAELLASALRLDEDPRVIPLLANAGAVSEWIKVLRSANRDGRCVAAVGHEPTLGRWLGELCFSSDQPVLMKKCAIAKVRLRWISDTIKADLEGLYQPGFMRKIARR